MSQNSTIEWTDATWNPVRGCSRVSPGCLNCYAEKVATRFSDPGQPFHLFADRVPKPHWTGKVELVESHLMDPLKWRKPKRIFVNSMSDLFHEGLSDEQIDRVFDVMALSPRHTFQILTKRPERMLAYCQRRASQMAATRANECQSLHSAFPDFLPNVWLGVSVENQATADARIPLLLQTPAAVRFVSYEPALGPVDFTKIEFRRATWYNALEDHDGFGMLGAAHQKLDWIIVGGESGPGARPFDIACARNTVQQCRYAGVACFVKQMGAKPFSAKDRISHRGYVNQFGPSPQGFSRYLISRKGSDMSEWPKDLRVRELPKC